MNQLCRVCGEAAAGFHFGAFTCEGCKSFFGRTYNSGGGGGGGGGGSLGHCKNGGRCIITKKNRTSCKACRLTKCIAAGMSKSGSRYGRRSNWFKIHCLLQEKASTTTALSVATNVLQGCKRFQIDENKEDSGATSPASKSPESQASNSSLEDPARTPFSLYPRLGVLSPFFLHPTSPYHRLPLYPYLYPVLSAAVSATHSMHAITPTNTPTTTPSPPQLFTPTRPCTPPTPKENVQIEPIDLSIKRPIESPPPHTAAASSSSPSSPPPTSSSPPPFTYTMRLTTASLPTPTSSPAHSPASSPTPVDLSSHT